LLVGAYEGSVGSEDVDRFRSAVCDRHNVDEPELVYRGSLAANEVVDHAAGMGVWLRPFSEYQQVWDHSRYLRKQTADLLADMDYPLDLHVDKRWAPLGEDEPRDGTAASRIFDWLDTAEPRFVLVLGDFGTGKTYLLHALAQALADRPDAVPVLLTMRDLEKGRTLDELLAQHMARRGEDPFHTASFRYLLRQGRIVLLFDGFDELALRTSYERVPYHFATLRQAAEGAAKVVVTSRHQHFATDTATRNAPGHRGRPAAGLPHGSAVPARRRAATGTGGRSVRG